MSHLLTQAYEFARQARENAYAPVSNFVVGAALIAGEEIFSGCNVEEGAFTSSIHAEQNALGQMITKKGKQTVSHIVVVGDDIAGNPCYPCGHCLQLLSDFTTDETQITVYNGDHEIRFDGMYKDLVPYGFRFNQGVNS